MWTRSQLKQKGKMTFKLNYWKVVLVALIVTMVSGGGGSSIGSSISSLTTQKSYNYSYSDNSYDSSDKDDYSEEDFAKDFEEGFKKGFVDGATGGHGSVIEDEFDSGMIGVAIAIFVITFLVVFTIILAICFVLSAFIFNPLEVGAKRFFFQNLNSKANVKEIGFGFDHSYKNIVKVLFFRDLYKFLWSLLLIVPGIVKSYEYRMIPYLLTEYPDMPMDQAFATSKRMMNGQKWRTFVLDLSFIGWHILSGLTLGILGIFYVEPYQKMTNAALYEALKYGGQQPQFNQNPYGTAQNMYGNPNQPYGQNMYGNPNQPYAQNMYGNPNQQNAQNMSGNVQQQTETVQSNVKTASEEHFEE